MADSGAAAADAAERREAANEAARLVRTLYLSFLAFSAYIAVTVAGITDLAFVKDAPIDLPVFNIKLPVIEFFTVVPSVFVLLHANLLLNIYFLWRKLDSFERALDDLSAAAARAERLKVFPLIFCQAAVRRPFPRAIRGIIDTAAIITAALLPFGLVLMTALRFHAHPDPNLVNITRLAVVADAIVIGFFAARIAMARRDVQARWTRARHRNWWLRGLGWLIRRPRRARRVRVWRRWLRLGGHVRSGRAAVVNVSVPLVAGASVYVLTAALTGPPSLSLDLRKAVLVDDATTDQAVHVARDKTSLHAMELGNITGMDLRAKTLARAAFTSAFMPKARLVKADLRGADFTDAALPRATLDDARLQGATLRGADLRGARLRDADLRGADLRGSNLKGARLTRADLRGANLAGATLTRGILTDAKLRGANLRDADADRANLQRARLAKADLRGANLDHAWLGDASLRGADLRTADLTRAKLRNADLRGARTAGADFSHVCGSGQGWPPSLSVQACEPVNRPPDP